MRRSLLTCVFTVAGMLAALSARSQDASDLLAPSRAALTAAREELRVAELQEPVRGSEPDVLRRADLLLKTGQYTRAVEILKKHGSASLDAKLMMWRVLLATYDYQRAGLLIDALNSRYADDPRVRDAMYAWWGLRGDLPRIERMLRERESTRTLALVDRFHAADLQLRILDPASARAAYVELLQTDLDERDRSRALRGLAAALFALQRYDESLAALNQALALTPLDADIVTATADTLLRLGRIPEAIDALTFALGIAPWNERAHRLLGSGYTRRNYTQLLQAFPGRFSDERGRSQLRRGDEALQTRRIERAREIFRKIAEAHPGWADVEARLGSLEYAEGNYAAARAHYEAALRLCPDYGRAHEGFARSIEALRLEIDIHRADYEAALAVTKMPDIRGIDRFVLNWRSISPRHQKQLALSLEPWARYIPALMRGGATVYVKPLYQVLSEAPHQELLRDQRIDYDSRLWDDVRGVGGHHTVFGVEDIETRIRGGYDTALHEVSHQVHAVLSPEWARRIQSIYVETTRRHATSGEAFLSQYAASSVWEYFAEGANSLHTPRRDRYDSREIVLERLQQRDPALLALVQEIMYDADVGPSFAAALVALGDDQLSRGKPKQADAVYRRALRRVPADENALAARIRALAILGRLREASKVAETAYRANSSSGAIVIRRAEVNWLSGSSPSGVIHSLEQARPAVRGEDQYLVDLMIGTLSLNSGDLTTARRAYSNVREYQPDNPQGLAGLAATEALDGNWPEAWRYYEQARQVRAGSVELRVLYARDLIRAKELSRAQEQIEAALLLDPEDPDALAVEAWRLLTVGDISAARRVAARAHELGPWSTLAAIMTAWAERRAGNTAAVERLLDPLNERLRRGAAPQYVYRSKWGRYDLAYTLPAIERDLMKQAAQ